MRMRLSVFRPVPVPVPVGGRQTDRTVDARRVDGGFGLLASCHREPRAFWPSCWRGKLTSVLVGGLSLSTGNQMMTQLAAPGSDCFLFS